MVGIVREASFSGGLAGLGSLSFWDQFSMILGSNLDGLPLPEHPGDLLAAAGGSPMPKS